MRGPLLALAAGLCFLLGTALLSWRLYSGMELEEAGGFWGPVAFTAAGAAALIALFLWLGRRR